MSHKDRNPRRCETGEDMLRWGADHGLTVEYGGRHPKLRAPSGDMRPVPYGNLAVGTKHAIIKWFIYLGIAVLALTIMGSFLGVIPL